MVTSRLNRIFTVEGFGGEEKIGLEWGFNKYNSSVQAPYDGLNANQRLLNLDYTGTWAWTHNEVSDYFAYPLGSYHNVGVSYVTARGIADLSPQPISHLYLSTRTVEADGDLQNIPALKDVLKNEEVLGKYIRLRKASLPDTNYLRWKIVYVNDNGPTKPVTFRGSLTWVTIGAYQPGYKVDIIKDGYRDVRVDDVELVGPDFEIAADDYMVVSLEGTEVQKFQVLSTKEVWGMIRESSAETGFTVVGGVLQDTALEQEATAVIRFDPDIQLGHKLTDDKGREWRIEGTRAVSDRRLLEYELTRTIASA